MTKKKKLLIGVPILLVVLLGAAYKLVLAPEAAVAKKKIEGTLYTLPNEFVLNLEGGQYAKITVAVELATHGAASEGGGHGGGAAAAALPQEAAVRAIVTDTITDLPASALTSRSQRRKLEKTLLKAIKKGTDEPIEHVLLTDIAVQ